MGARTSTLLLVASNPGASDWSRHKWRGFRASLPLYGPSIRHIPRCICSFVGCSNRCQLCRGMLYKLCHRMYHHHHNISAWVGGCNPVLYYAMGGEGPYRVGFWHGSIFQLICRLHSAYSRVEKLQFEKIPPAAKFGYHGGGDNSRIDSVSKLRWRGWILDPSSRPDVLWTSIGTGVSTSVIL